LRIWKTAPKASDRASALAGSILGIACQRRRRVDHQHEILLADHGLELRQREPRPKWREAQAAHSSKYALIGAAARHADVDRDTCGSFAQAAHSYARFELGNPLAQQLAMERVLAGLRNGAVPAGSMPTAACSSGEP
jgi:hypothetical protein